MRTILLAVLFLLGGYAIAQHQNRIIYLGRERVEDPDSHLWFEFFHDTETKQEVVCVYGGVNAPSCYLTGRTW
jgi:hypothetical protein